MDITTAGTVVGLVAAMMAGATALVRLGAAIRDAERRAKHDAIDQVMGSIADLESNSVQADVYHAELTEMHRRLVIIERRLRLDGTDPGM